MISELKNYILSEISAGDNNNDQTNSSLNEIENIAATHPWFTKEHLIYALSSFAEGLPRYKSYFEHDEKHQHRKKVGFWFRPLSPCEGLPHLLFALKLGISCEIVTDIYNKRLLDFYISLFRFFSTESQISCSFVDNKFGKDLSAIVVIGETPSQLQMEYLSRQSVFFETAERFGNKLKITGNETPSELKMIAHDLGIYFGRSIFNKSVLIVPENYNFEGLAEALQSFMMYSNHSRYFNHYEYRKAGFIVGKKNFIDTGIFLLTPAEHIKRHTSVIQYFVSKSEASDNNVKIDKGDISELFGLRMFDSLPEFSKLILSL